MRRLVVLIALLLALSGCGVQGQVVTGKWMDGPDTGRKVFCVGGQDSLSCDWPGYHGGH